MKQLAPVLALSLMVVGCSTNRSPGAVPELAQTLPVYELEVPGPAAAATLRGAQNALGITGSPRKVRDRVVMESGALVAEAFATTGGIWAADRSQLWNPELRPSLPDSIAARRIADQLVGQNGIVPAPSGPVTWEVSSGGTMAGRLDLRTGTRTTWELDRQVIYSARVQVPELQRSLPVVGGGGQFTVTLGEGGRPIGLSGVWRGLKGVASRHRVIPRASADASFQAAIRGFRIVSTDVSLAYYSAPVGEPQQYLYPVYVYRAVAQLDSQRVPLRLVIVPATEVGPRPKIQPRLDARPQNALPQRRPTMDRDDEQPAATGALRASTTGERVALAPGRNRGPSAPGPESRRSARAEWEAFEAGTSWIGASGGLAGSHDNAKGFVDGLRADGWAINFNWGDANAWESDWRAHNDSWVDAADFVFYTGHANLDGWVLSSPDDGFLSSSEVGSAPGNPGDLWGQQDLEWIIVAACGPLQDNVISAGGGDVFNRWRGAFDGLHLLLGYGAVTYDNTDEGARVVRYARDGATLISAWFRAAQEIQPATNGFPAPDGPRIWVGVVYPYRSGTNVANDHLWGHGSVSADPRNPDGFIAMWTTT